MNNRALAIPLAVVLLGGCAHTQSDRGAPVEAQRGTVEDMGSDLGNFSVSLSVKDIAASRAFYEKIGFRSIAGDQSQNWLIMQNGSSTIGLFQGMFERNMLTFNPGWDRSSRTLEKFDDVRDLQAAFKSQGLTLASEADPNSSEPASFMVIDPDGNPILVDQHVAKPTR